jgi:hypothetical protein
MSIADKAIAIIQERYESSEYQEGIASMTDPEQRIYGAMDKIHTAAVLEWVEKLYFGCPDALRIAAAGHDWDRAFEHERDRMEDYPKEGSKPISAWYDVHKMMHAANTARILRRELGAVIPSDMMLDVVYLVLHHETGGASGVLLDRYTGTYDLNNAACVLQRADSLAFFNILDTYVEWRSSEKVEQKIRYMYGRASAHVQGLIRELSFENPKAVELFARALR